MAKTYFITDTHLGEVRLIDEHIEQLKTVRDEALHSDDAMIIHLGDFFHTTKIDTLVLNRVIDFFDEPETKKIQWKLVIGNHDIYFKDSLKINSLTFLRHHDNVEIIDEQKIIEHQGYTFLLVPYVLKTDKNFKLKESDKKIDFIAGHFELNGFKMHRSSFAMHNAMELNTNTPVLSGHFHLVQKKGNIFYIGNTSQTTRTDFGEDKGYYNLLDKAEGVDFFDRLEFRSLLSTGTRHINISHFGDTITINDGISKKIIIEKPTAVKVIKALKTYQFKSVSIYYTFDGRSRSTMKKIKEKIDETFNLKRFNMMIEKPDVEQRLVEDESTEGNGFDIVKKLYETLDTVEEKTALNRLIQKIVE